MTYLKAFKLINNNSIKYCICRSNGNSEDININKLIFDYKEIKFLEQLLFDLTEEKLTLVKQLIKYKNGENI